MKKKQKKEQETRNRGDQTENIEHQKELTELEDVSHKHKGGFEKNHIKPEDMRSLKNQNN